MFITRRWILFVLLACLLRAEGADKYTDENRPYEFGFNIEGEQHRHEKKDENGIIMGEYGFITADGVYHVTVYATDENGGFRILSMKNIRTKPYPTDTGRQGSGRALELPSSPQAPESPQPPQPPQTIQQDEPSPIRSCSHCSIPTTPKPPPAPEESTYERFPPYPEDYPNPGQNQYPSQPIPEFPRQYPEQGNPRQEYPEQNYPQENNPQQNYPEQSNPQENSPQQNYPQTVSGQRNPKQYNPNEIDKSQDFDIDTRFRQSDQREQYQPVTKPMLISVDMRVVDRNTDVHKLNPGERQGLPAGLDKNDMMLLLYTFNYTVGFHGHHEEGYTNGAKKGYYYVTGRNGIRTRVDYTADDQGFHPKITQEVLDLLSDDVPKPETERDEKYGLKGYEFKWIYYPVGSKR